MSEHTKGPWFVETAADGSWNVQAGGYVLCQRQQWTHRADESTANGRLIATAPELLVALKAFVENDHSVGVVMRLQRAVAAIDKAEGRSNV